jgi:hypothetical protein
VNISGIIANYSSGDETWYVTVACSVLNIPIVDLLIVLTLLNQRIKINRCKNYDEI